METLKIVVITVLCSLCGTQHQKIIQTGFVSVKLGHTVIFNCVTTSIWKKRAWYKLGSNRRLQLLASTDDSFKQIAPFDSHYAVSSSENENSLTIKGITVKDVGLYICSIPNPKDILFGPGTDLVIEEESKLDQSVLQSPEYIRAKPGDSVTLSCSFTSGHCPKQLHTTVVRVRSGSASSGIVFWNYGKKIFCENSTCVYYLTLKNISSAEDGTYLCVVTACGETMIGTGTRIQLNDSELYFLRPAVVALIGSNAVVGLVVLLLLWGMWRLSNNKTEVNSEHQRAPHSSQPDDTFTFAAGSLDSSTTVRRRKHPDIYSQVCYRHCK